ncbi:hypothetical protein WICMUC_001635 [Wickerhamomyces mucosus]|uniref:Uncharacterized protein n=1 Tax=Wickerhamomyces mucosus TaxID=1378264 RepID=A0A9P8PTX0_9ASCO|nr:hypothetical protein WICMUC_001635 [Wickerhamomyces mucosus]
MNKSKVKHSNQNNCTFKYSNECSLEVHCSPFGISGLYIKIDGFDSIGIGSSLARLTGKTSGIIYYNNEKDLINCKYKLFGNVVDDDDTILRIDFIKIFLDKDDLQFNDTNNNKEDKIHELPFENPNDEGYEIPDIVFRGKVPSGKPDILEPFIGIFNFEKPPSD